MARGRHAEKRELDLRIRTRATIRVLLAVLLVVPLVAYNALGVAGAAPGGVTSFSIDGNTAAPNDWDDSTGDGPYHVASIADKCEDSADDSLVPGTKLDDPWPVEAHKANSKGDICRVWTGWERRPDGHVVMLFGWQRLENTGQVTIYVPLEGPAAGRGDDRLIKFDYDSDVKLIEVSTLTWNGSSWGNEASLNPALAEYAVSGDTRFAEIGLDLTGSGILPEDQCKSFVGARVLTETGQAEANPTLKDYVDISSGTFTFNSCGTVIIRKHTEPTESLQGPFTAHLTGDDVEYAQHPTLAGGGSVASFIDLEFGSYTVSEDDPTEEGFALTSIICEQDGKAVPSTFEVLANSRTTCVITNTELPEPDLSLVKSAVPGVYDAVGQVISYSYVLTNTGNVTLSGPFSITDDKATDEECPATPVSLDPGESITCAASYTITQSDLNAGSVTNVATGYAWYGDGQVPSNPDDETVDALQTGPTLLLDKSAAPSTYSAVGQVISYSYVLKNIGNVTLSGPFSITDDKATDEECPTTPATLDPGESITCAASYTITQSDLNAGSVTNVATGYAWYGDGQVPSNPDDATVDAVKNTALLLDKSAAPSTYSAVGQVISYSYVLKNIGNVTLYGPFSITDDKATAECPLTPATLDPGESITCTASYTITQSDLNAGSVTNVARGRGYDGSENPVESNEDTTTVRRPSPPDGGPTPTGSLGDLVWSDLDADGYQGDFEPGVAGVTVALLNSSGVTIDSKVTDASGKYLFTGLSAGTYFVKFELPAGYKFSPIDNVPSDALDSDAGLDGRTVPILLSAGVTDLSWDAGIFREERVLPQVLTTALPSAETLPFTGGSDGATAGIAVAIAALGWLTLLAVRRREDEAVVVEHDWYDRLRHYDLRY